MEEIFLWLGAHKEFFGFITATIVFFVTIFLVSRQAIGFAITLLLLVFSLLAGFSISYYDTIKKTIQTQTKEQTRKGDLELKQRIRETFGEHGANGAAKAKP